MKSLYLALLPMSLLVALASAPTAHAAGSGCRAGKASVTVNVRKGRIPIDHTKSMAEMWRLSGRATNRRLLLNGLYRREIKVRQRLTAPRSCGGRTTVRLDIVLASKIYLRADMGRNACFYQVSRKHELEHLAIDYTSLKRHGRRLQRRLHADLARLGPPPEHRALEGLVNQRVAEALTAFDRDTLPKQDAIDTPAHARRIYARCGPSRDARQVRNTVSPAGSWVSQSER